MSTEIETYTGRLVNLAAPQSQDIDIMDIAWALSRAPRFVGMTTSVNVYSVAQHSVLVMNRVKQTVPDAPRSLLVAALLHDAHEAYMGDISRPMSSLLDLRQPISRLKSRLQRAILKGLLGTMCFELGSKAEEFDPHIKAADEWARNYEAYHLMHSKGYGWEGVQDLEEEYIYRNVIVHGPAQACESFLNHFKELMAQ